MKLNNAKFGLAWGISFAILWLVCSMLVWLAPSTMAAMTGHMLHIDMQAWPWALTTSGVIAGLVGWTVTAGITGALVALTYNFLTRTSG